MRWVRISAPNRIVGSLLLALQMAACSSWVVPGTTPLEYLQTHTPEEARVTRSDSSRVVLSGPRIQSDSVVGVTGGGMRADDPMRFVSVALADVAKLEVKEGSAGASAGVVLGLVFLVGLIGLLAIGGDVVSND